MRGEKLKTELFSFNKESVFPTIGSMLLSVVNALSKNVLVPTFISGSVI